MNIMALRINTRPAITEMKNSLFIIVLVAALCCACASQQHATTLRMSREARSPEARSPFDVQRERSRGERAYMTSMDYLYGKMYLRAEQSLSTYPGVVAVRRGWPSFAGFEVYTDQPGEIPEVLYGFRVRALPRQILN